MSFLDDNKHHKLKITDKPREKRLPDTFQAFVCEICGMEFYILDTDLKDFLTGKRTTPMKADGKMYFRSGGEWQLIYTLIN